MDDAAARADVRDGVADVAALDLADVVAVPVGVVATRDWRRDATVFWVVRGVDAAADADVVLAFVRA